MPNQTLKNTRPLIVRFGALGDMILLTPVMRALAERHGAPCDVVGSGRFLGELFSGLSFVGDHFAIASRSKPYWLNPDKWALVRWLRARHFGPVYVMQSDQLSIDLLKRGCSITGSVLATPFRNGEHVVEHYARITDTKPGGVELAVSPTEINEVDGWLESLGIAGQELVLVQPGNSRTMRKGVSNERDPKFWPEERWLGVIRGVADERPRANILIIGAPSESEVTDSLAKAASNPRVISVAHDLPLRRLFALFKRAGSLISIDTGPAHAAVGCGCPVAVLFAAADPRRIRPYHSAVPVSVVYGPADAIDHDDPQEWAAAHSMDGISIDVVLTAWRSLKKQNLDVRKLK